MIIKITKRSIILKIVFLFLLIFTIGLGISSIISNNDLNDILAGLCFIWIGLWGIYALSKQVKTIEILDDNLIIYYPIIRKKIIDNLSNIKFNDFESRSNLNVLKGILLKLEDGKIIELYNSKNSTGIINYITKNCERKTYLKLKKWDWDTKAYAIGMIIISITMILIFVLNN